MDALFLDGEGLEMNDLPRLARAQQRRDAAALLSQVVLPTHLGTQHSKGVRHKE